MKSLIWKDLYNIGHNIWSMVFMLVVFVFILVPQNGPISYIITSGILCGMMVITTFAFDDHAKWTKYAMIMPLTRKDIVRSKFIVLLIFSIIGVVSGTILGVAGGAIFKKIDLTSMNDWMSLLVAAGIGLVISCFFGCLIIPLLFKYGAEKARALSLVAFVIPVLIFLGIYYLLLMAGIVLDDTMVLIVISISPVVVLLWALLMYKVSYGIFRRQEF
ncbi:ABC-2 transporter permease [Paenibacillus lentus]|uniref:ABC-2 transporter permease n=1 Tax=Paenibacillus lentus TaxID=1338368 RepID=UPI003650C6A1